MTLVYTAPLAYDGDDRLDVSRWGTIPFGPSLHLMRAYKSMRSGARVQQVRSLFGRYAQCYRAEMERLPASHWNELLARPLVTLCCYCRVPTCATG